MERAPEPIEGRGRRGRWVAEIEGGQIEDLRNLASKRGATLFSTMLSAFQIVMAKATGKQDILVGSPIANRSKKRVWDTMGSFASIVPMRGLVDAEKAFADQLAETHQMTVDCLAHAMPFVELVACLEEPITPGRNPIFDVRFALQNHPMPDVSMQGMEVEYRTRSTGTCRFDLACELTEIGRKMEVVWLFREDVFSPVEVEHLHRHFVTILKTICEESDARIITLMECLP